MIRMSEADETGEQNIELFIWSRYDSKSWMDDAKQSVRQSFDTILK